MWTEQGAQDSSAEVGATDKDKKAYEASVLEADETFLHEDAREHGEVAEAGTGLESASKNIFI